MNADMSEAAKMAKQTAFFKHFGFDGTPAHIDDKYGIDVDDVYEVEEILPEQMRLDYILTFKKATDVETDEMHLGYFKLDNF